ncbi:MAG: hypothetical protein MJA27_28130 [Pseudanabaenales cyanobacterium]|nr:hypothetical protein [Pseudanabaenales cyanobacterium]
MIRIFPDIEFNAQCPIDAAELHIKDVVIPGMRCLADSICPICNTRYYVDLPVGHALWFPTTLNQSTAEIYTQFGVNWFSQRLRESFLEPVEVEPIPIIHKFFDADRIIILNCLDFLYGHSLLKLLNVQYYLDNHPELGCCVLAPTQLLHLVPKGVAEIWEFPISIKEGWKWYLSLQNWMSKQFTNYKECFLSPTYPHPSNQAYDLTRFVRDLPNILDDIEPHRPVILFSYREDRPWGNTLKKQQYNLQKLYNQLSTIFPALVFVLIGFGQQAKIHAAGARLIDLRTDKFCVECDRLWLAYMSAADCAVGVHGSNMLLPSGLARSTVELVPRLRVGNTVQDFLFPWKMKDVRDALLFYRMIYGNNNLSDIDPVKVTDLIVNVLSYSAYNVIIFGEGTSNELRERIRILRESEIYKCALNVDRLNIRDLSFSRRLINYLIKIIQKF